MAGNYPDVPGHRFVIDRDGTQGYLVDPSSVITQLTPTNMQEINNESMTGYVVSIANGEWFLGLFFPEPRTIAGAYYYVSRSSFPLSDTVYIETSEDTTNFIDGTWDLALTLDMGTTGISDGTVVPDYRELIQPLAVSNVKAIRFRNSGGGLGSTEIHAAHVYGSIPTSGSPDRLVVWHPTLDEPVDGAYFDWGDSPRSSSEDRTFRVKNLSGSLTANNITVSFDALTDGSPSVAGMHLVSDDGVNFAATESILSIGPGVISSVLTMRRVLPSNAPLGLWAPRVHAVADSWS